MLSKTWKQRKYENSKIYLRGAKSIPYKKERGKKKPLLQRSTKFKQVLHKRGFPNDQ